MSPNEHNEDIFSLGERETVVTDIRSSYSFIFNQLVQIYKTHHQDEKLSTKAKVAVAVETLHNEGKLTDYPMRTSNPAIPRIRLCWSVTS